MTKQEASVLYTLFSASLLSHETSFYPQLINKLLLHPSIVQTFFVPPAYCLTHLLFKRSFVLHIYCFILLPPPLLFYHSIVLYFFCSILLLSNSSVILLAYISLPLCPSIVLTLCCSTPLLLNNEAASHKQIFVLNIYCVNTP